MWLLREGSVKIYSSLLKVAYVPVIAHHNHNISLFFLCVRTVCVCNVCARRRQKKHIYFESKNLNGNTFFALSLFVYGDSNWKYFSKVYQRIWFETQQKRNWSIMVVETNRNSHRGTLFYSFEVPKDQNLLTGFKRYYGYKMNWILNLIKLTGF